MRRLTMVTRAEIGAVDYTAAVARCPRATATAIGLPHLIAASAQLHPRRVAFAARNAKRGDETPAAVA